MTSLDEMKSLPTDLQFKLLSKRLPEAVVMTKVYLIIKGCMCVSVILTSQSQNVTHSPHCQLHTTMLVTHLRISHTHPQQSHNSMLVALLNVSHTHQFQLHPSILVTPLNVRWSHSGRGPGLLQVRSTRSKVKDFTLKFGLLPPKMSQRDFQLPRGLQRGHQTGLGRELVFKLRLHVTDLI